MATEQQVRDAFVAQHGYCSKMDAPITARVALALAHVLSAETETGRRALDWPGEALRDALPLRLVGGFHALDLNGSDRDLSRVFAGEVTDQDAIGAIVARVLAEHDAALLPWLDGPPQTNEAGRSGALMTGLIEIAARHGPRLELLEIGSSAGLNLLIDRYRFDLGGRIIGPADAPLTIRPEWRGSAVPDAPIEIVSVRGCDVQPLDPTDPAVEARLKGYVWADAPERLERLAAGIAMQRARPVDLVKADAADWVEARLGEPQAEGVTRVLIHSVVWQYIPRPNQDRIRAAMAAAAERATSARPLAWVRMEPDGYAHIQAVTVQSWPAHGEPVKLALSHAHGAWVERL